ncbi:MAG: hypothetical protein AAF771_03090, partial [Pseudomonadota bacterium]
ELAGGGPIAFSFPAATGDAITVSVRDFVGGRFVSAHTTKLQAGETLAVANTQQTRAALFAAAAALFAAAAALLFLSRRRVRLV